MQNTIDDFFGPSDEDKNKLALLKDVEKKEEEKRIIEYKEKQEATFFYGQIKRGNTTFGKLLKVKQDLLLKYGFATWVEVDKEIEYPYFEISIK